MKVNTKYFIEKSNEKHGSRYDYSQAIVETSRSNVLIGCKLHGIFTQSAHRHMRGQGCPTCKKRKSIAEFIDQANIVHDNVYDYSLSTYNTNRIPIDIICKIHGTFQQTPSNHLRGHGCRKCNNMGRYTEGWFCDNPDKCDMDSILYVVQLTNDNETFYKIGITSRSIDARFDRNIGYDVQKIASYNLRLYDAFKLEQKILNDIVYCNRWIPKQSFGGERECFGKDQLSTVLSVISSEIPYIL